MQIKKGFKLRRIDDLFVVIAGAAARNFHGMITLNESGAFLWEKLTSAITVDELVDALCAEYGIDREVAQADVEKFLTIAREQDLLDE